MYIKARGPNDAHGRSSLDMLGKIVLTLLAVASVRAQIPSLGFCPDYVPMANFDMNRFLGVWYEAERYFQLTEVVSRCVMANYTKGVDGKYRVSNEVTNRFTGIKRILEGEIKKAASKAEEGKLHVKYTIPLTPETKYSVLETDYDSYAVLWSCSGLGPFHTQNAWVMTRERLAPGSVLQKAYGVLDKYKISKSFFVKTDQDDCALLSLTADKPAEPAKPEAADKPEETATAGAKFAGLLEEPEVSDQTKKAEIIEEMADEPVEKITEVAKPVETVPEHILKVSNPVEEEKLMESVQEEPKKETVVSEAAEEKVESAKEKSA